MEDNQEEVLSSSKWLELNLDLQFPFISPNGQAAQTIMRVALAAEEADAFEVDTDGVIESIEDFETMRLEHIPAQDGFEAVTSVAAEVSQRVRNCTSLDRDTFIGFVADTELQIFADTTGGLRPRLTPQQTALI
jgi:hypothetical protein